MPIPPSDPSLASTGPSQAIGRRGVSIAKMVSPRNVTSLLLMIASFVIFAKPVSTVLHYPLWGDTDYDKYSYSVVIPFLSAALIFLEKEQIFAKSRYGFWPGSFLLFIGVTVKFAAEHFTTWLGIDSYLSIELLGLVIFWLGVFIVCYGMHAFQTAAFALLFLLLTVPLPDFFFDRPIALVQNGSADVCSFLFTLLRIPVLRNGLEFSLPNVTILVGRECSGIHSTMAIFILSVIAGYMFLPSIWKRVLLVLTALPIVCMTNGLRIAGLTLLSEYVNRGFLYGDLHRKGGVIFFLFALLILFSILQLLKRVGNSASRVEKASL